MADGADGPVRRVYVVDDHEAYREVVERVIRLADDLVLAGVAGSTEATLDDLVRRRLPVDLALVDVDLGTESGIELVRRLRERRGDLRVVLMSSLASDELPAAAGSCGADGFLPKADVDVAALREAVGIGSEPGAERPTGVVD